MVHRSSSASGNPEEHMNWLLIVGSGGLAAVVTLLIFAHLSAVPTRREDARSTPVGDHKVISAQRSAAKIQCPVCNQVVELEDNAPFEKHGSYAIGHHFVYKAVTVHRVGSSDQAASVALYCRASGTPVRFLPSCDPSSFFVEVLIDRPQSSLFTTTSSSSAPTPRPRRPAG
jgi:hypothetical protein